MNYESPQDIQNEIMKLLPGYYNLGQPRKPVPNPDAYLSDGYVGEVGRRYSVPRPPSHAPDGRSFSLLMGQLLYHSGKLSTQAPGLIKISPNTGRLHLSQADMNRLGLGEGARVRATSARGSLTLSVQMDGAVMPGCCFFPEHFNEPPVKDLMPVEVDAVTGVPSFKLAQVTIEKV
jgi:formate dehydrogenase alpha subunit